MVYDACDTIHESIRYYAISALYRLSMIINTEMNVELQSSLVGNNGLYTMYTQYHGCSLFH